MARSINTIQPANINKIKYKNVAAYARVSSDTDRLMHSLSAQISYYSELIQKTPGWRYVGVYADEGITGTKTKVRNEFIRMITDCEAGKIDLILTKSVSRFARNTVDLLSTVRKLRELGVDVYFEKEQINAASEAGELMLTLYASLAQEEIYSMSENIKWAIHNRYKTGLTHTHFNIYGYRWSGDTLIPYPEEAQIVRSIFECYLSGQTRSDIAMQLNASGTPSPSNNRWTTYSVRNIITNITYTGNLMLQKHFVVDPITKRTSINHGELPMYFVESTHEAIVSRDSFDRAQTRLQNDAANYRNTYCFTGIIKCSVHSCSFFRCQRNNRKKNAKYVLWSCGHNRNGHCCFKDIPDLALKKACSEVLETSDFDPIHVQQYITKIEVLKDCHLRFTLSDGSTKDTHWKSDARQRSWTPERRAETSAYRTSPVDNPYKRHTFSFFFRCAICGSQYKTNLRHFKSGDKRIWAARHNNQSCCRQSLSDEELQQACCSVLGIDHFDPIVFNRELHHAEIIDTRRINFTFRNSHIDEYRKD